MRTRVDLTRLSMFEVIDRAEAVSFRAGGLILARIGPIQWSFEPDRTTRHASAHSIM